MISIAPSHRCYPSILSLHLAISLVLKIYLTQACAKNSIVLMHVYKTGIHVGIQFKKCVVRILP